MGNGFEVLTENISIQAHFAKPVFTLLQESPLLAEHLFRTLSSYGTRLSDFVVDPSAKNFGEVNLQLSLRSLVTVRVFLDRIELSSGYLPFLAEFRDGAFTSDLLGCLSNYTPDASYRTYAVTQELHGRLRDIPLMEFLNRFTTAAPSSLGPLLASGTVFYFGADEARLTGSLALDFSGSVEGGLFFKLFTLYDAAHVTPSGLIPVSQDRLSGLCNEIGLELIRRAA